MQFGRNKDETYIEKGSGGTAMKKETPEQQSYVKKTECRFRKNIF